MEATSVIINPIIENSLKTAITYKAYKALMAEQILNYKGASNPGSTDLLYFTKLNYHRMARLDKTVELEEETIIKVKAINRKQIWLLITEGWCGDAAQIVPIINKMAEVSSDVELKIVLRDQNLELIDNFLTNGGRAIPKLIVLDPDTLEVLNTWGPRPEMAQQYMLSLKQKNVAHEEIKLQMQKWYISDKAISIQQEVLEEITKV